MAIRLKCCRLVLQFHLFTKHKSKIIIKKKKKKKKYFFSPDKMQNLKTVFDWLVLQTEALTGSSKKKMLGWSHRNDVQLNVLGLGGFGGLGSLKDQSQNFIGAFVDGR